MPAGILNVWARSRDNISRNAPPLRQYALGIVEQAEPSPAREGLWRLSATNGPIVVPSPQGYDLDGWLAACRSIGLVGSQRPCLQVLAFARELFEQIPELPYLVFFPHCLWAAVPLEYDTFALDKVVVSAIESTLGVEVAYDTPPGPPLVTNWLVVARIHDEAVATMLMLAARLTLDTHAKAKRESIGPSGQRLEVLEATSLGGQICVQLTTDQAGGLVALKLSGQKRQPVQALGGWPAVMPIQVTEVDVRPGGSRWTTDVYLRNATTGWMIGRRHASHNGGGLTIPHIQLWKALLASSQPKGSALATAFGPRALPR